MARYAYGQVWYASPQQKFLMSPYESHGQLIKPAQPVTIALRTCMVHEDLESVLSGDNDILITAKNALGDRPQTDLVLFYEKEIAPGKPIRSVLSDNVFVTEDYSGERIWLEVRVAEVDTNTEERTKTLDALKAVSQKFGAAFPIAAPYAFAASAVARGIDKIFKSTRQDTEVLRVPLSFFYNDSGATELTEMPLQKGTYVLFAQEQYGEKFQLDPSGVVLTNTSERAKISYVVIDVDPAMRLAPKYVVGQKMATLMTQLRFNNEIGNGNSLEFLNETITEYNRFSNLERYAELKAKSQRTPEEEKRMQAIAGDPALKPYIAP